MPQYAIIRMNFMVKQQKSEKGMKFGDRKNSIDGAICTGVIEDLNDDQELTNNYNYQHEIVIEEPQEVSDNNMNNADSNKIEIDE